MSGDSFVIAVHARPDADTIGSALALARGLRQLGKQVTVLSQDGVPETCLYLPDASTVLTQTDDRGFDVGIVCDADGVARVGTSAEAVASATKVLVIDHHLSKRGESNGVDVEEDTSREPDMRLVDTTAAATAELVFELLHELHAPPLCLDTARQLMAAIVGDTGAFRFTNVTPDTLEIASRLTAIGAPPSEAAREIFENRGIVGARLLGTALLAAQVEADGKLVWSQITQEDLARFNATDNDTDSIVNQLRAVRGAEVGILFREISREEIRISLRSRGKVDVNKIAQTFGGGGHISASGCTVKVRLEEAKRSVIAEVRAWMES